jgi:hypothetical protein
VRIEGQSLLFFDLETRALLRTRPNPIPPGKARFLRGVRPAGPPPRPASEPVTVQRRASNTGVVMVCGQKIALGRVHAHRTVSIHVAETTLAIELDDGETRVVRRTTTLPVRSIKATDHGRSPQFPSPGVAYQVAEERRTSPDGSQPRRTVRRFGRDEKRAVGRTTGLPGLVR